MLKKKKQLKTYMEGMTFSSKSFFKEAANHHL